MRSPALRSTYLRARTALTGDRPGHTVAAARRAPGGDVARLRRLLPALRRGRPVPPEQAAEARRLAFRSHLGDESGTAIEALTVLADRWQDPAARARLSPALAHAGRFAEAADRGAHFPSDRPRGRSYVIMVTALHQLGRADEAEQLIRTLTERFPGLAAEFTDIWGQDRLARAYRALQQSSPGQEGRLPVFQHLPFCAGTSIQAGLKQVLPWAREFQITRHWGLLEIERLQAMSAAEVEQLMLIRQHHPCPLDLPGRKLSHFTVLRDPVAQIRSGYYKRAERAGIVLTRDTTASSFADHVEYRLSARLTNLLSRMLVINHPDFRPAYADAFDRPGAYTKISFEEDMFWVRATERLTDEQLLRMCRETLEQEFHLIGTLAHPEATHLACTAATGAPVAPRIGHHGRSGQPLGAEPGRSALDQRLREANAVDQQLYEEYTARFAQQYSELIAAASRPDDAAQRSG